MEGIAPFSDHRGLWQRPAVRVGGSGCSFVSGMLILEDGWMPQGRSSVLAPVDEAPPGPPVTAHGPGCDWVTPVLDDD